jgi:hypothetical protein
LGRNGTVSNPGREKSRYLLVDDWPRRYALHCFDPLQLIGVLLAATGSIISNLGLNLQKLNHQKTSTSIEEDRERNYAFDPLWFSGFLLVVFGSVFDVSALAFAAQSIVR